MIFEIYDHEKGILDVVATAAKELGFPVYLVGGFVRDRLLGRQSKDIDVVCVGNGIALANRVAEKLSPKPHVAVFTRFGTAMLRHEEIEIEFVGARKESYRSDSRNPTVEEGTLEDDQNRRDFTINALAVSLNTDDFGRVVDSFGGLKHLEEKLLITPLQPEQTFIDDPLRMMRAIRFATQLGFRIDEDTLKAIAANKQRIKIISQERILIELEKIMATPRPSVGYKLLYNTGLLDLIFPELTALKGAEMKEGIGHKDNFYHSLQVLDNICPNTENPYLRWAALLHDIGKPATKRFEQGEGWTFHGHQEVGANMIPKLFKRLSLPNDARMKYVQKIIRLHHRPVSLTKEEITDSAMRRLLFDADTELEDLMTLCEADITSKNPEKVKRYLENYEMVRQRLKEVEEKDQIRNWQPPISGELIMVTFGIPASRPVGIIKNAIREAILDGIIPNDYSAAYDLMLQEAEKLGLKSI